MSELGSVGGRVEKDAFSTLLVALGAKQVAAVIGSGAEPVFIAGVCGVHTLVVADYLHAASQLGTSCSSLAGALV